MTFEQGMDKTAQSNANKFSHNFQSELDSLYGPRSGDHHVAAATAPPGERATDQNKSLPGLQLTGLEELGKSFDPGMKIAGAQDNRDNIDHMPKGDPWNGKDLDPGFSPRQYMPIKGDANGPDIDPGFSGKTDTPNFGGGDKQPDGNIYWPDGDRPGTRAGEGRCQPDPEDVLPRFNGDNIDNMPNLDPWKGKDLDPGFEIGANKPSASSAVDSLPDLILF